MSNPSTDKALATMRRDIKRLKASMCELLDCYWGQGDGDEAPEFIQRAAALSGWKAPTGSLKGTRKGA